MGSLYVEREQTKGMHGALTKMRVGGRLKIRRVGEWVCSVECNRQCRIEQADVYMGRLNEAPSEVHELLMEEIYLGKKIRSRMLRCL